MYDNKKLSMEIYTTPYRVKRFGAKLCMCNGEKKRRPFRVHLRNAKGNVYIIHGCQINGLVVVEVVREHVEIQIKYKRNSKYNITDRVTSIISFQFGKF